MAMDVSADEQHFCKCNIPARLCISAKGNRYYRCCKPRDKKCDYWEFADPIPAPSSNWMNNANPCMQYTPQTTNPIMPKSNVEMVNEMREIRNDLGKSLRMLELLLSIVNPEQQTNQ